MQTFLNAPRDCVIRCPSRWAIEIEHTDEFHLEHLIGTRWSRIPEANRSILSFQFIQEAEQIALALVHRYGLEQAIRISELRIAEPKTNVAW